MLYNNILQLKKTLFVYSVNFILIQDKNMWHFMIFSLLFRKKIDGFSHANKTLVIPDLTQTSSIYSYPINGFLCEFSITITLRLFLPSPPSHYGCSPSFSFPYLQPRLSPLFTFLFLIVSLLSLVLLLLCIRWIRSSPRFLGYEWSDCYLHYWVTWVGGERTTEDKKDYFNFQFISKNTNYDNGKEDKF